ncbi:MAG TPA: MFS transporter, partial [Pararhizobium sp.]|nr:MFS transporter [Pararhizobium sp.]
MALGKRLIEKEAEKAVEAIGGLQRLQVIGVLAATLGLDSADKATISAVSAQLKHSMSLSNTEIGALLAVVSFVGAIVTFPAGVLADRFHRKTILTIAVGVWALGMIASGLANSYTTLLIARVFLGIVTAAAWPCIASLTGDLFPARERASIYGLILTGELVGTAIGFFISAEVVAFADWHWAFYVMAAPSVGLVVALWWYLPEPERGGQSWLSEHEHEDETSGKSEGETAEQDENPAERIADE